MAKGNRVKIGLKCSECGDINYSTIKKCKNTDGKTGAKEILPEIE